MSDRPAPGAPGGSLLRRLEATVDDAPSALARAARYVLENPEKAIHQSLAELSSYSEAGQASIVRLCRELGFKGFTEFKLALSADLARQSQTAASGGAGSASPDPFTALAERLTASVLDTRRLLDPAVLQAVADRLAEARRIDLFGAGASGLVADLLAYRLLRLGLLAASHRDAVLAHEISGGLGPGTAAIAVSQSGLTNDSVKFLRFARDVGAFTLAITGHARSPLARVAEATLVMARLPEPSYGGTLVEVPRNVFLAEALALALGERRLAKPPKGPRDKSGRME